MTSYTKPRQKTTSTHPLHKYVVMGVSIWFIFLVTFAVAHFRVSQSEKYDGLPLRSLTEAQSQRPADSY